MKKTLTLLIGAMGGEGGGVLTNWIVDAARLAGLAVQATSVPGVAQRTGATTYYIELGEKNSGGKSPIFSLYPIAGCLDVMLSSELLEASRALSKGHITAERTRVITSSNRSYSTTEKITADDSRLDSDKLINILRSHSRQFEIWDMRKIADKVQTPISPVMLGLLARSGLLPIKKEHFEEAINKSGKSAGKNIAAFNAAVEYKASEGNSAEKTDVISPLPSEWTSLFPTANRELLAIAYQRLLRYQDKKYADLLMSRLEFCQEDSEVCNLLCKELTALMAYEDVIRVAQLKTESSRFLRIKEEQKISEEDIFELVDFLKPGMRELVDVLPFSIGQRISKRLDNAKGTQKSRGGMTLKSSSISGFLALWILTKFRFWRRKTYRFIETQNYIEQWLQTIQSAFGTDRNLALEIINLGKLIKGYGETHEKGKGGFDLILREWIRPFMENNESTLDFSKKINRVRTELLAKPEGADAQQLIKLHSAEK